MRLLVHGMMINIIRCERLVFDLLERTQYDTDKPGEQ